MQFKDQRSKLSLWSEDHLAAKVSRTLRSKSVKQKGPIYRILRSYLPTYKKQTIYTNTIFITFDRDLSQALYGAYFI